MHAHVTTVRSGTAALSVSRWGEADTTIVALHPGVGDSRIWNECAPLWVAAGHRVVAFDRRGFGATTAAPETHDDLDDLLAVLDATETARAVIVGNSRGGGLALDLAAEHPDRVSALVLIAASPSGYQTSNWPLAPAEAEQDEQIAEAESQGDLELVNRLEVRYWLDGTAQPEGRVGDPARSLMLEMNGAALRADPIGSPVRRQPVWPRLAEIDIPSLVVVGEHDLPGVIQQSVDLAAALPQARLERLADSAHCPSLDQPEMVGRLVVDFVADLG